MTKVKMSLLFLAILAGGAAAYVAFGPQEQRLPPSLIDQNREYSNGQWHSVGQPDKPWR